jgi:ribosomal small subunit protein bTHX
MGKGDIKTKRGKITNKSFGKKRPHHMKEVAEKTEAEKTSK